MRSGNGVLVVSVLAALAGCRDGLGSKPDGEEDSSRPVEPHERDGSTAMDGPATDGTLTCSRLPERWVAIWDVAGSPADNPFPGPDVCGIQFRCPDGSSGYGIEAELVKGCCGTNPAEPAYWCDTSDPSTALGPLDCSSTEFHDDFCNPQFFVSLGEFGELYVAVDDAASAWISGPACGLTGCAVVVNTLSYRDDYEVAVCTGPHRDACRKIGDTYTVPTDARDFTIVVPP